MLTLQGIEDAKQEAGTKGASAELISKAGDRNFMTSIRQETDNIGVVQLAPGHLHAQQAHGLAVPGTLIGLRPQRCHPFINMAVCMSYLTLSCQI